MHEDRAESEGIKGAVEDVKGKAKETAGSLLGNDSLHREGQIQQDKADAQQEAAERQAEADTAQAEAERREEAQRFEQNR